MEAGLIWLKTNFSDKFPWAINKRLLYLLGYKAQDRPNLSLCLGQATFLVLYICILSHIVISLSLFMVPSLCGLSTFNTLNSVFNTCHFIKIFKNTTCFGLNRPSSGVKKLFIKKIAAFRHSCSFVPLSSVCLFLVVFLRACDFPTSHTLQPWT
jgi:hypothetical protein